MAVLADEVPGLDGKKRQEPLESLAIERLLQVLDDVELDATVAQNLERAA